MGDSRLVYSTDDGDLRRGREREAARERPSGPRLPDDGIVRVFREKGGRGGQVVTVVRGLAPADLDAVARDLKRRCGAGGAAKGGAVEIQGDHRETVAARLRDRGYDVKLAGG